MPRMISSYLNTADLAHFDSVRSHLCEQSPGLPISDSGVIKYALAIVAGQLSKESNGEPTTAPF